MNTKNNKSRMKGLVRICFNISPWNSHKNPTILFIWTAFINLSPNRILSMSVLIHRFSDLPWHVWVKNKETKKLILPCEEKIFAEMALNLWSWNNCLRKYSWILLILLTFMYEEWKSWSSCKLKHKKAC